MEMDLLSSKRTASESTLAVHDAAYEEKGQTSVTGRATQSQMGTCQASVILPLTSLSSPHPTHLVCGNRAGMKEERKKVLLSIQKMHHLLMSFRVFILPLDFFYLTAPRPC